MDAKKHPNVRYKFTVRRERRLAPIVGRWGVGNERKLEKFAPYAISKFFGARFITVSMLPSAIAARHSTATLRTSI